MDMCESMADETLLGSDRGLVDSGRFVRFRRVYCVYQSHYIAGDDGPIGEYLVPVVKIFAGVFVGIVTFLMLDGMDLTYKQKIGRSVLAAYIAIPLLHGLYALAKMFEKNPEKWIKK